MTSEERKIQYAKLVLGAIGLVLLAYHIFNAH